MSPPGSGAPARVTSLPVPAHEPAAARPAAVTPSEQEIPMIVILTVVLEFIVSKLAANHNLTALRG